MGGKIHPTAIVDPQAKLGSSVEIGPYVVIGPDVSVGEGSYVGPHSQLEGPTEIGRDNHIAGHACIGLAPQDLKYADEPTTLEIGDRNRIREFTTFNRGTVSGGGRTTIGSDNLFMTAAHVAHDCHVGSHTVFANAGTLAGHVTVEDWATIGAFSAVRQYNRVGQHAYIGGYSVIILDVLPFSVTVGQKARCVGVNSIGLERRGFEKATIRRLERAFRVLLRSRLNTTQALEVLRREHLEDPCVRSLVEFVESSERGVTKMVRKGSRGAGD